MATSKLVKHSIKAGTVCLINLSSLCGISPSDAAVINGDFETGVFTGFETIGDTSIQTAEFGSGPTEGDFQALVTNGVSQSGGSVSAERLESFLSISPGILDRFGNGNATQGSGIRQTFFANAGDVISFNYNFLTTESTPSFFNDFAFISLNPFSLELADTNSPTFVSSPTRFDQETGFQTFSAAISNSGTYTLGIGVVDVADTIGDSGLLVDNIQVEAVPEPLTVLGSGMALGFGALMKRQYSRKRKKI